MTLQEFEAEIKLLPDKWVVETSKNQFYCYIDDYYMGKKNGNIIRGGSQFNWPYETILQICKEYDSEKMKRMFRKFEMKEI